MSFSGDRIPKGYGVAQVQQFNPDQMKMLSQLLNQLGPDSFLAKIAGGDQSAFDEMEAPAKRQFAGTIGNLGSRFSGMGTGALKSSGFQNTANQAGMDFASQLQSNRSSMRMNAIRDLQSYGNALLQQRPTERGVYQKQQKQGMDWGSLIGQGAGMFMDYMSGGATAIPRAMMSGASRAANNSSFQVPQRQPMPNYMGGY